MGNPANISDKGNGRGGESVFIRPRPLPGVQPTELRPRLREDVKQEALAAGAEALRKHRPLPRPALTAIIEAIHSPPENLTPAEAAIAALNAYNEAHPST